MKKNIVLVVMGIVIFCQFCFMLDLRDRIKTNLESLRNHRVLISRIDERSMELKNIESRTFYTRKKLDVLYDYLNVEFKRVDRVVTPQNFIVVPQEAK